MGLIFRWVVVALALELMPVVAYSHDGTEPAEPAPDRLVAIGDTHGDFDTIIKLLQAPAVGILDKDLRWAGQRTHLVVTGDMLDRGSRGFDIIKLFMRLEREAARAGGKVTVLLGNHEVMNLTGFYRDVYPDEYGRFAGEESSGLRRETTQALKEFLTTPRPELAEKKMYEKMYMDIVKGGAPTKRDDSDDEEGWFDSLVTRVFVGRASSKQKPTKEEAERQIQETIDRGFARRFPPGYFARHRQLSLQHEIGRWLLSRKGIARIGSTLFMHGGLSLEWSRTPFAELERRFSDELVEFKNLVARLEKLGLYRSELGYDVLSQLLNAELRKAGPKPPTLVSPSGKEIGAPIVVPAPEREVIQIARRIREIETGPGFDYGGILWYRGWATGSQGRSEEAQVDEMLANQKAKRMVVGHTVTQSKRIEARFNQKVWLIDVGMNHAFYQGQPEALEILQDTEIRVLPLEGPAYAVGEKPTAPKSIYSAPSKEPARLPPVVVPPPKYPVDDSPPSPHGRS
ncbi:MAG: metallophosphoesterase [Bacteriovoracia bacterium]